MVFLKDLYTVWRRIFLRTFSYMICTIQHSWLKRYSITNAGNYGFFVVFWFWSKIFSLRENHICHVSVENFFLHRMTYLISWYLVSNDVKNALKHDALVIFTVIFVSIWPLAYFYIFWLPYLRCRQIIVENVFLYRMLYVFFYSCCPAMWKRLSKN